MRALWLTWVHLKVAVAHELQYRADLVAKALQTAAQCAVSLGGIHVVLNQTDSLSGWSGPELVSLVGVYILVEGLLAALVFSSLSNIGNDIRQGDFDFVLLRPDDSQVLASVRQISVWEVLNIVVGLGLICAGNLANPERLSVGDYAAFAVALPAGFILVYSLFLTACALCFWTLESQTALFALRDTFEAGRWPLAVFPGWLRAVLTFVLPVGLAVTVPAQAITGEPRAEMLIAAVLMAGALGLGSRTLWRAGIKHYSGASA